MPTFEGVENLGWDQARDLEDWFKEGGEVYDLKHKGLAYRMEIVQADGSLIDAVVVYNSQGLVDLTPYAIAEVKIGPLQATRKQDFRAANVKIEREKKFGDESPEGYTWHHADASGTMQLIPTSVHQTFTHRGGRSLAGFSN